MTLEEAIEHNKESERYLHIRKYPDDAIKAIRIGIEALKRVVDMRISPCTTADEILLGETEK